MRTAVSIVVSSVLLGLGAMAVFSADLDVVGSIAMALGLAGLTLACLVWAARGPGAVQDPSGRDVRRGDRRAISRLSGPRAR